MSKDDKLVMTVPVSALFRPKGFEGYQEKDKADFLSRILANYTWSRRGDAETDGSKKQPIGYGLIVRPKDKKVFVYQRATHDAYDELRLRGKWSWGIGGHINQESPIPDDPVHSGILREISEEIDIDEDLAPELLGYINDDQTEVGKVHFGLLYLIPTSLSAIQPRDKEIARGQFMSIAEVRSIYEDKSKIVESWSRISFPPLLRYLSGL